MHQALLSGYMVGWYNQSTLISFNRFLHTQKYKHIYIYIYQVWLLWPNSTHKSARSKSCLFHGVCHSFWQANCMICNIFTFFPISDIGSQNSAYKRHWLYCRVRIIALCQNTNQKSRIRDTKPLLTNADSSTDTTVGWTKNTQKPDFFEKRKKSSKTQKLKNI